MNRLLYLIVHCLLTPKGRWITKGDIDMWHMGPLDLPGGKVRYKGIIYSNRDALPLVKINGVWIKQLYGNGWDRAGYADILEPNGTIVNVTPYNKDAFIDKDEITWGAVGVNSVSRHLGLAGSIHPITGETNGTWDIDELYTKEQPYSLAGYIRGMIHEYPWIRIAGHRDVPGTSKTCPNFDVLQFCRNIGIQEKNIGLIV